ncbi:MAG: hypothetical protein Q8M88_07560 [Phenylobacterium sp.]|uniref:hypothetical protein n=1 Tax=Phenylobacterium sp. TaxID=1871053 RepID=UPI0027341F85|nr:hypothetical protein [Phenylobacterium sp.]MDP3174275.1 hypothetical protein [Phenylobacterium sp.]
MDDAAIGTRPVAEGGHDHRGQWVVVLSAAEIAATLDADGRLDGLPFMPEMARFCGMRLRIHRHAEKTCVEGLGLRRMGGTVLLEGARCDGAAHDGCARRCMMFWKEAWLRPVHADAPTPVAGPEQHWPGELKTRDGELYVCQSTALGEATASMSKWSLGHLATDLRRGEITPPRLANVVSRTLLNLARRKLGMDEIDAVKGPGTERRRGRLNLQAGEWVRIKPVEQIQATLDANGKNLGLAFEPEMKRYAGGVFQVEFLVDRIIQEETGVMSPLTHTVALRDLVCQGICVKNCPRSNPLYWRESWLERVEAPHAA